MGTSKILLLTGVYAILGVYTVNFSGVDQANYSRALEVSSTLQSEQLATAGVSIALTELGSDASKSSISTRRVTMLGGTVTISAERPLSYPATLTQVVSTGLFNNEQVRITSVMQYNGGRWKVLRTFTQTIS